MIEQREITAVEIARRHHIDPRRFRAALRKRQFKWHEGGAFWTVKYGSPEHEDMEQVMRELISSLSMP